MNELRENNYFALDLELNNKNDGSVPKIIQVGVAIGSNLDNIKTYSWYLNPEESITPFITKLTGITDDDVVNLSVTHQVLAEELGAVIKDNNCFVNPVTWGQGDSSELLQEFKERNVDFPFFGRRIIDVKTLYVFFETINGRSKSGGLRKSMNRYKIPFIGTSHRADVDAYNTLRFYFFLMERQRKLEEMMQSMKSISY